MKSGLENLKKDFFKAYPNRVEWVTAAVVLLLYFFTMFYRDNLEIFNTHFILNENFINGQSISFLGSMTLPYGVLHQWVCAIWVLPINLLYHLLGITIDSPLAILWCKLCVALFFILCMREMKYIADDLKIECDGKKWMQIFCITSILVALPIFHVAQTDALYLLFMMKGFRALINQDTKRFLVWFAISVSFKMLTLFIFIPLILLEEKRIFYVIRNLILGCIIIPLEQIWYRIIAVLNGVLFSTEQRKESVVSAVQSVEERADMQEGFYSGMLRGVLYFEFPALKKGYTASVMVFFFALLCIWCYMQKKESTREWQQKCLYGTVLALLLFFTMACPMPYWIVIAYPFLFLLIYTNPKAIRFNLLLEKVFTLTMFLVFLKNTYWVYGGAQSFDNLFLTKWGIIPLGHEFQGQPNIFRYLEKAGIYEFLPIITAICLAGTIGILWINHAKVQYDEELTYEYTVKLQHGFAVVNIAILFIWYAINVILIGRY